MTASTAHSTPSFPGLEMFSQELLTQLAQELDRSEKTRVQVEHFSRRFPGMTVEDGYRVSREWVRHADIEPDRRARLRHAARQHALPLHAGPGAGHSGRPLHRAARGSGAGLRAQGAAARPRPAWRQGDHAAGRAGRHRPRDAGHRDHRRAHRAVRPPHQSHAQGLRHHQRQRGQCGHRGRRRAGCSRGA